MPQVVRTIENATECKATAQYLIDKHRGSGGFGLLEKAVVKGETIYLQDWIDNYGSSQIWRQAQSWLRKWRHKRSVNTSTTLSVRSTTLERLRLVQAKTGLSHDQIIVRLLDQHQDPW